MKKIISANNTVKSKKYISRIGAASLCLSLALSGIPATNTFASSTYSKAAYATTSSTEFISSEIPGNAAAFAEYISETSPGIYTLSFSEELDLIIPKEFGNKKIKLVIDAPNAAIVNEARFKRIIVKSALSYTENISGNSLYIKNNIPNLIIGNNISAKKVSISAKEAAVTLSSGASLGIFSSSKKSKVNIMSAKESLINTASPEAYDIGWWIKNRTNTNTILTKDQIDEINQTNFSNNIGLVKLLDKEEYSADEVRAMIEDYSFPSKEYVNGRKVTEEEKEFAFENRNLEALTSQPDIRYAITTENADIRAFPTDIFLTNEKGLYDYLQETGLNYGEPIIVLWDSKDGEWSFVQGYDYNGWMKKSSYGLTEKGAFEKQVGLVKETNLWCAKKTGTLEFTTLDGENISLFLRMGTYLGKDDDGNIILVSRNKKGSAVFTKASVTGSNNTESSDADEIPSLASASEDTVLTLDTDFQKTDGLLEFNTENLLLIAQNALGTPYSWGDMSETGMDCSSTLQGIFKCFGVILPRNSSQQIKLSGNVVNISELTADQKLEYLSGCHLGTILYLPGHVMLYLGTYNGIPYILHNTTDSARDDGGVTLYNSCVLTTLTIGKTGNTLLDRLTYTVSPKL